MAIDSRKATAVGRAPGRHPSLILFTCCSLLLTTASLPAQAVGRTVPAAERVRAAAALKRRGDSEMDSLHYAEAAQDYADAFEMTHDPALIYNRARALQALQKFSEALKELERFTALAPAELKARVPQLAQLHAELESRIATLMVRCSVPDARILVRGQVVGITPIAQPVPVNAGPAMLEVVADGYVSFHRQIELPGGGALEVVATLAARDAKGQLHISSVPDDSDVFVDGKPFGRTPMEVPVSPGNHELRVVHESFTDVKRSILVVEDERKDVSVTLQKRQAITDEWWFWPGVVVVGAAAVATVTSIAVLTDKPAGHGDIGSGQVTAPLLRY